jgi:hypothetical protein
LKNINCMYSATLKIYTFNFSTNLQSQNFSFVKVSHFSLAATVPILSTYYFTKFAYKFGYLSLALCFGKIISDFRFFTHDAKMLELEIGTINSDFRI